MTPAEVAERVTALLDLPAQATPWEASVDVPRERWVAAVVAVRDDPALALVLFDLLAGVDEGAEGFGVVLRLWSPAGRHGLLLRTRCDRDDARVPSLAGVFGGAAWHERTLWEMFGVLPEGHPALEPLLLPAGFGGHPLRKDFVLASRAVRVWPGAVEPGQSAASARPSRRRKQPPGVPAPGTWPAPEPAAEPSPEPSLEPQP